MNYFVKNFHHFLDKIFKKRLSFSVFFRIWFAFGLVIVLASGLAIYQLQKTIKPSAQRVVEDTLVDVSRLLAVSLRESLVSGEIYQPIFQQQLANAFANTSLNNGFSIWYDQKQYSQFHVYITNNRGIVIYDSQNRAVGKDFSRWNDVYLTLNGKYGARSSKLNPNIPDSSVMYVASPIIQEGKIIGVVSVGKPVMTLVPYIHLSRNEIAKTMFYIALLGLFFTGIMAFWLRHSIQTINRYTKNLATDTPPHFYLGKELNELTFAINQMKHDIENKAYVTDYVHTLTHELKSPLTAIRASGELLGELLPDNDREQFSQTILQQSDKLQSLIERLLMIAKIEQPTFKLSLKKHDICHVVNDCIHYQQAYIHQKNITTIVNMPKSIVMNVDSFWLQQALQNVIDNAIKFGNQYLIILLEKNIRGMQLDIINDSPELPNYVAERAFERYFSLTQQNTQNHKGTGLGLTLAKQVIERHHGNIMFGQIGIDELIKIVDNTDILYHQPTNFVKISIFLPDEYNN